MKTYHASRSGHDVTVLVEPDGAAAHPLPLRLDLRNHSPTGFEWGYAGSGPAQLALAICADVFGDEMALTVYQGFKDAVIARLPQDNPWSMTERAVREALPNLEGRS